MNIVAVLGLSLLGLAVLRGCYAFAYSRYAKWEGEHRHGLAYFGQTLAERRAFKSEIKKKKLFYLPYLKLEALFQIKKAPESFLYKGYHGPVITCSVESFQKAISYKAARQDIFVASHMRSGTTWLQQIVYEMLMKGKGDLSDQGHRHLQAVSPWIEAHEGVPVHEAPLVGEKKERIIKTHLPSELCPFSNEARYLYIVRDPLSCFASICDFFKLMSGDFSPSQDELCDWFTSDRLWWGNWPEHVKGWWQYSEDRENTFLIHYDDLRRAPEKVLPEMAKFLGAVLTNDQKQLIAKKMSFKYMKENEELFEMSPPNLYSVKGSFFVSGGSRDKQAISKVHREKILRFCADHFKKGPRVLRERYVEQLES